MSKYFNHDLELANYFMLRTSYQLNHHHYNINTTVPER